MSHGQHCYHATVRQPVLPLSALPPLRLPHDLELFGRTFRVTLSTGCTFAPDTLMRAIADTSLDALLRKQAPRKHLSMKKFVYAATGRHRALEGTQKLLVKEFSGFIDEELMRQALNGQQVAFARTSSWQDVLRGLGDGEDILNDIASCFAACDLHVMDVIKTPGKNSRDEADAYFTGLFSPGISAWRAMSPGTGMQVSILVEVALQALVWLEHRLVTRTGAPLIADSAVLPLLDVSQRPVGNWLTELLAQAKCKRLRHLEWRLAAKGIKHLDRPISADLMRKWSAASTRLMPKSAMEVVVGVIETDLQRLRARSRWYVARYFTFLGALVRAGTEGPRPEWGEVQKWMAARLQAAYELQCRSRPA